MNSSRKIVGHKTVRNNQFDSCGKGDANEKKCINVRKKFEISKMSGFKKFFLQTLFFLINLFITITSAATLVCDN